MISMWLDVVCECRFRWHFCHIRESRYVVLKGSLTEKRAIVWRIVIRCLRAVGY